MVIHILHITNIYWDTTDDNGKRVKVKLPKKVDIIVDYEDYLDIKDDSYALIDFVNDQLSDTYGFCVEGWEYHWEVRKK